MNPTFILDLAILGTYARKSGQWFRQKDVRFVAESLWTMSSVQQDLALHNTQILRRLEGFYGCQMAARKDGPEYRLGISCCSHLIESSYKEASSSEDFQKFLLAYYFLGAYGDLLLKLLSKQSQDLDEINLSLILNSKHLLTERLQHLENLESLWSKRVETENGLIAKDRLKKLWNPSLRWIRSQREIPSLMLSQA